jgi:hypothetical protein
VTATYPFQADTFQNDTFQTQASPYVYPNDLVFLSLTINAVEMKDYLNLAITKATIASVLTKQYDTCTFTLYNVPSSVTIQNWQEVIIKDSDSRIFAGVITLVQPSESELTYDVNYSITCVDYSKLLETKLVQAVKYTSKTDAYILNDIFTTYLPEVNATTYVSSLATLTSVPISRKTIKEALNFICGLTGADWYVDYDKKLHYFKSEDTAAPFGFSDQPDLVTAYPYSGFTKSDDGSGIFNVVEVVGGNYNSGDETIYLPGTGANKRIVLPFVYQAPAGQTEIQVWRNDGSDAVPSWTAMTVLEGYVDALGGATDVLYYQKEGVLEQSASWPNLAQAVKLTGQYEIPLRTRIRDEASISLYGREIQYAYFDNSIIDKSVAKLKGQQLLLKASLGAQTYSWVSEKRGIRSGMTAHIKNDALGIDDDFLVQRATLTIGVGGLLECRVDAGNYNSSLVDILIALKRLATPSTTYNTTDVLDVLLSTNETLKMSEAVSVSATTSAVWDTSLWDASTWG